jgi:hypothetical protein
MIEVVAVVAKSYTQHMRSSRLQVRNRPGLARLQFTPGERRRVLFLAPRQQQGQNEKHDDGYGELDDEIGVEHETYEPL